MATETDAARERVLVARAQLGDELALLEASARSAVDIPAKVKASPAKAAAVAGTAGFVVLGGPRRVFGGVKRVVRGPKAPLPKSMLPDEIEATLKHLGSDGDAVRGRDSSATSPTTRRRLPRIATSFGPSWPSRSRDPC